MQITTQFHSTALNVQQPCGAIEPLSRVSSAAGQFEMSIHFTFCECLVKLTHVWFFFNLVFGRIDCFLFLFCEYGTPTLPLQLRAWSFSFPLLAFPGRVNTVAAK
jgi:hypothetical protein